MELKKILAEMTEEEKVAYCSGADFWHTKAMPQYGVPAFKMADGPHGLRCQPDSATPLGVHESLPATCFPAAVTAAATWDEALLEREGEAIAKEALAAGVFGVLGPGCNIKRDPRGGRNFEYFSEDPLLSGKMAAAFIRGVEGAGAFACLKHFAANNQEYKRQNGDSRVDERTLREIYLAPFEIAVKEGHPRSVMCSYNKINGIHASDNEWLLTRVLRHEWGFNGAVITDWGALNHRTPAFRAGCDLAMPGGGAYTERDALRALREGELSPQCVDASVSRILRLAKESERERKADAVDADAHHRLARLVAEEGAVLLKNRENVLPLAKESCVLIGRMAEEWRYQGSGSSHINPTRLVTLRDAMQGVPYYSCTDGQGAVSDAHIAKAAKAAAEAKVAVVVVGLPEAYESEGFDRADLHLPEEDHRTVRAVAAANPRTVVVLLGGGAVELPWEDDVAAILYMGLSGQAGGEAAARLLTGEAVPSGKLAESWPLRCEDAVSCATFGEKDPEYREGIYVGYRYYETAKKEVKYPFGFGLSYTSFAYGDLRVTEKGAWIRVKNTGAFSGAEVVQLYVSPPKNGVHRPARELKGFRRVMLASGEEKEVFFPFDHRTFAIWQEGWRIRGGCYTVEVGASSKDIRASSSLSVAGEALPVPPWQAESWYQTFSGLPRREDLECLMGAPLPPVQKLRKGQFTMDNTVLEMKGKSFVMWVMYHVIKGMLARQFGRGAKKDPGYRMVLMSAVDGPLRQAVISSGGILTEEMAKGLLLMANGKFFRGMAMLCKRAPRQMSEA